jgi:hypothetical protein
VPALGDENVRRLDVAVKDALDVRRIQSISDLDGQGQSQLGFHRSACDAVLQRQALQELHGDECFAVLVVNFVNRADVGMVQCGSSLGLTLKAAECLRVFGYVVRQEFEGDKPAQLHILSFVDHSHPATAELLDDAVMRDGLADHWSRIVRL